MKTTTISNNNSVNVQDKNAKKTPDRSNEKMDDTSTWVYPLTEEQLNLIRNRMISIYDFNALNDNVKKYYIKYTPVNDPIMKLIKLLRKFGVFGALLAPIFEIVNNLPNPNPLQQLATIMEMINKFFDLIANIRSIKDIPIIGTLAAPVIDIFLIVWDIIVSIVLLILCILDGKMLALLTSKEYWEAVKKEFSDLFSSKDEIQKIIDGFNDTSIWDYLEEIIGKKEVKKIKKELLKMIKPVFDMMDTFKKMSEAIKPIIELFESAWPLSEKSWWNAVCKFMFGRTAKEMLQGSKELNKMMKGPLELMDQLADGMNTAVQSYYITIDDFKILQENIKKKKELEAKEKKENNILNDLKTQANEVKNAFNKISSKEIKKTFTKMSEDELINEINNNLKKLDNLLKNIKLPNISTDLKLEEESILSVDTILKDYKETPNINKELIEKLEKENKA